jgi:hypothetical protein
MKTLTELAKRVADEGYAPVLLHPEVWRLCELVAAEERKANAKMVDHILKEGGGTWGDAIRARGQA